jgi:hypothetical protein
MTRRLEIFSFTSPDDRGPWEVIGGRRYKGKISVFFEVFLRFFFPKNPKKIPWVVRFITFMMMRQEIRRKWRMIPKKGTTKLRPSAKPGTSQGPHLSPDFKNNPGFFWFLNFFQKKIWPRFGRNSLQKKSLILPSSGNIAHHSLSTGSSRILVEFHVSYHVHWMPGLSRGTLRYMVGFRLYVSSPQFLEQSFTTTTPGSPFQSHCERKTLTVKSAGKRR